MGKSTDPQISSSFSQCFFKFSLLCFAIFFPFLIFSCFQPFGFSSFVVTIFILILSTVSIIKFLKKKVITVENPNLQVNEVKLKINQEIDSVSLCNNDSQQSEVSEIHDYQVESTDFPSASDSGDDDFSESENWAPFNNVGRTVSISEILDSSSDDDEDEDENLIEISFPDSNSADLNEESEEKLQTDLPEFLFESVLTQEGLMEILADVNEVNEEDNLIEIDLSMGSIKGSNLEAEA